MSNLLETIFRLTVLLFQVMYGKQKTEKQKKCNITSYMGSHTNWESIFQQNKKVFLMPPQNLAVITYPYPDELLNRRSEQVAKCRHENKFLLKNFNSSD